MLARLAIYPRPVSSPTGDAPRARAQGAPRLHGLQRDSGVLRGPGQGARPLCPCRRCHDLPLSICVARDYDPPAAGGGHRVGAIEMRVLEVLRRLPASAASVVEAMARAPHAREVAAVEEAVRQAIGQESRNNKGRSSAKESVVNESRFDAHASKTSQRREWGQSATGWKREWETWERGPNLFGLLILPHLSTTRTPRHQLLIPGGRLAAAVWGPPAHALTMSLPMRIIRQRRTGRSTLLR